MKVFSAQRRLLITNQIQRSTKFHKLCAWGQSPAKNLNQRQRCFASLNANVLSMPRSGIRTLMEAAWKLEREENKKVIHLEVGQPDLESPASVMEAAHRFLDLKENQQYIPNLGKMAAREKVAEYFNHYHLRIGNSNESGTQSHSLDKPTDPYLASPKNVALTPGCMFAMATTLLACVSPGDKVLIPDPGFPNYRSCLAASGACP